MLRRTALVSLAIGLFAGPLAALANTWPTQPVHFVVPFPPGGSADGLTRMLAQRMEAEWKQPVIVDNKPGAGTIIGADAVAKSNDGHTIGLVIPSFAVNPGINPQMPYDTLKDLAAVTQISTLPIALFASNTLPVSNVAELIAYAKKNPKTLSYGSAGTGSTAHLAGQMLNQMAGIDMVHVPYKGSAPAQTDLIGGRLGLLFDSFVSQLPMVQAGRIKLIAAGGSQRLPGFPKVAPIGETVRGFAVESYFGVIAPRSTAAPVLAQIQQTIKRAMADPKIASWMSSQGMVPVASTPQEFEAFIDADMKKWAGVVKTLGGKIE
ncbi:tripartite tricarboxylate transporter substrate binding protein [Ramlibacter sp. AN1133]|uniref:tripartite tricarboxylate transporter substrate binding protein n=1 Tax=Ramlibacter sp. AN1133 TaxID=3133429 RepID=UPI0030C3DEB0